MRNILQLIASLVVTVFVAGCTTGQTQQSKFTAADVAAIKAGMTKSDVTAMLGEPRSRSVDNDGNEIWQYRKNAQEGKGLKTFADITSFGLTTGTDAEYQDILTVAFKNDLALKATYEENVHNLTGLGNHN